MKTFFKIITYFLFLLTYVLLFTIAGAMIFSQTEYCKKLIKENIVTMLNQGVNGEIKFSSIEGNLFSRLTLENPLVTDSNGDTLISVAQVNINYMPLFLLTGQLNISNFEIVRPDVRFLIDENGKTNFDGLIKEDSTSSVDTLSSNNSESFIKRIRVKSIAIKQGKIWFANGEHTKHNIIPQTFDYDHFQFDSLNLALGLNYKSDLTTLEIFEFNLKEKISSFAIQELSLKLKMKNNQLLDISKLIVKTDHTSIDFIGKMNFVQPITTDTLFVEHLKDAKLNAEVSLTPFDFKDLYTFLPVVDMLKGPVNVSTKVSGSLDTLRVDELKLKLGLKTKLSATGKLFHLLDADLLSMDVRISNGKVFNNDIQALLPTIGIPSFEKVGLLEVDAHYFGEPLRFAYDAKLNSESHGEVFAFGNFDFTKDDAAYSANLKAKNVNLAKWLNDENLTSNINLNGEVAGKNFTFDDLVLKGSFHLDQTQFQTYKIDNADLEIEGQKEKTTLNLQLSTYFADMSVEGTVNKLDTLFSFDLNSTVRRLNVNGLAAILAKTKIDFAAKSNIVLGSNYLATITDIDINRFTVGSNPFDTGNKYLGKLHLDALLSEKDNHLDIKSDYLDAQFSSSQTLPYWQNWFKLSMSSLSFMVDSTQAGDEINEELLGTNSVLDWNWKIKNAEPVMALLKQDHFNISAEGKGKVSTKNQMLSNQFSIKVDSVTVNNSITVFGLNLTGKIDSISSRSQLDSISGKINLTTNKIITGDRLWGSAEFETNLKNNKGNFKFSVNDPNNLLSVDTNGKLKFYSDSIIVDLKKLDIHSVLAAWTLDHKSQLRLTQSSIGVDSLQISSKKSRISLIGELSEDGTKEMVLLGTNMEIAPIINIFNPGFILLPEGQFSFKAYAYGERSDPSVEINLDSSPIKIKGNDYGKISGIANLADKNFDIDISLLDEAQYKMIEIVGIFPNQDDSIKANNSFDVALNNFNLGLLRGFIPTVVEIGGVANANLHIEQIEEVKEIVGNLVLSNGSLRLESNNVLYSDITGKVSINNNFVNIAGVNFNSPNDGKAQLFGTFELENFIPMKGYNLTLVLSDFLILNKVQDSDSKVYGTVSMQGQLKLRGGYEQSNLNGNLKLKKAEIGLLSGSANDRTFLNEYSFINFTSAKSVNTDSTDENLTLFKYKKKEKTFLSGFNAFIQLDATQNADFSLLLNKATGERLETSASGNLTMQYQRENLTLTGVLNVLSGKYDFYTAKFVVQDDGFIRWGGNTFDPELKLVAKTNLIRQRPSPSNSEENIAENNTLSINIEGQATAPKLSYDILSQLADGQTKSPATSPTLRDNIAANVISLILINQWANDPWVQNTGRNFSGVGTDDIISNTGYNALFGTLSNHLGRYLNSADNKIKYVNLNVQGNRGVTENWGISGGYEINDKWTFVGGFNYGIGIAGQNLTTQNQAAQKNLNLSFRVENKITENLSWDIFQDYDPYSFDPDMDNQTIYGVSLFYRKRFYHWKELNPFTKNEKENTTNPITRKTETGAPPDPEKKQ